MQPLAPFIGLRPNPHVQYGQADMQTQPTTFNRIGTRWGDVQLSNGWQSLNYGRRGGHPGEGYLMVTDQTLPGQTRLIGSSTADFPLKGPAPSQWDYHVANTAGAQPSYPGGPGYAMGPIGRVGSSGG